MKRPLLTAVMFLQAAWLVALVHTVVVQSDDNSGLDVDSAATEAALLENECEQGDAGEEGCAVNLLALRGQRLAGRELEREDVDAAPPSNWEGKMASRQDTPGQCRCPSGQFRCTTGKAKGGCFANPMTVSSEDCTGFTDIACDPAHEDGVAPPEAPPLSTESGPAPAADPAQTEVVAGAPPPVAPVAVPPLVHQGTRLQITNGCLDQPMWIANMAGAGMSADRQNVKLAPLASHDFGITDGLASTRYWPKLGCNAEGNACTVGESGGPGQTCNTETGCAPPVDSKFEATFGTLGAPCQPEKGLIKGCDWLDISLVDGFSVPFKVDIDGQCGGSPSLDCTQLQLENCPEELIVKDPVHGKPVGCYSPCAKKTFSQWKNVEGRHAPDDPEARMQCCPTPPVTPEQ